MPLEDVFISDIEYSKGLSYKSWRIDKGDWTFKGNGKWVLNYILEPNENASIIVKFKTSVLGNLTNNATSGFANITLANATNVTRTLANPKLDVRKITNNESVYPGEEVSFTIVVRNVGKYDCTGVYIVDNKYSKGLVYDYFVDPTNSWTYQGKNRWNYNKVLEVGEESEIILFFMVKSKIPGLLFNTVLVGNNQTNLTEKSTNHTKVKNRTDYYNDTDENKTHNKTHNKTTHHKYHETKVGKGGTGNPLYALTLVLATLGVITSRRRK